MIRAPTAIKLRRHYESSMVSNVLYSIVGANSNNGRGRSVAENVVILFTLARIVIPNLHIICIMIVYFFFNASYFSLVNGT